MTIDISKDCPKTREYALESNLIWNNDKNMQMGWFLAFVTKADAAIAELLGKLDGERRISVLLDTRVQQAEAARAAWKDAHAALVDTFKMACEQRDRAEAALAEAQTEVNNWREFAKVAEKNEAKLRAEVERLGVIASHSLCQCDLCIAHHKEYVASRTEEAER